MKKIIAIAIVLFMISCTKDKIIEPVSKITPTSTWTGIVYAKINLADTSTFSYAVHKITAPNIYNVLLPIGGGYLGHSNHIKDSIPLILNTGDSLAIGGYIKEESSVINLNLRTKLYHNGVLIFNNANIDGQFWIKLP